MEPTDYLTTVLDHALNKSLDLIRADGDNFGVDMNLEHVEATSYDMETGKAVADITWRVIPKDQPTAAYDMPSRVELDVEVEVVGFGVRVNNTSVVTRGGADITIAGVATIIEGEDYTTPESAGQPVGLASYVNHVFAINDNLWNSAKVMQF